MTHAVLTATDLAAIRTMSDEQITELYRRCVYHMPSRNRSHELERGTVPNGVFEEQFVKVYEEMVARHLLTREWNYRPWDGLDSLDEYPAYVCTCART